MMISHFKYLTAINFVSLNYLVLNTSKQLTLLDEIFMVVIEVGTCQQREQLQV